MQYRYVYCLMQTNQVNQFNKNKIILNEEHHTWVVPYPEDTPERISHHHPDLLLPMLCHPEKMLHQQPVLCD